jgi:exosortase/archaeosortase family protein
MSPPPKARRGPWTFVALFALCAVGLLGGYRYAIDTIANDYYLFTVSRHTTWILDFVGHEATLEKYRSEGLSPWESWRERALPRRDGVENGPRVNFVLKPGHAFTFIVVPSCGAIEVMAIFLAAVLAFPATWRHRAWGVALGLPLMYLVNLFRLACLACLGALDKSGAWFNFVHEYVWQAGYVIFVVIVWMAWAELGRERPAA